MVKINVKLENGGHVIVEHEVSDIDVLANELAHGIDLIISEIVPFERDSTLEENMDRVQTFKNNLLDKIKAKEYTCLECYTDEE